MKYEIKPLTNEDADYMEERIDEFDDGILPPEPDAPEDEYLVLMAEDNEGNLVAGLAAMIYNWGQLDDVALWVNEAYRKQGLGSALLRKAEHIAKERGCYLSLVETFDFQAKSFCDKQGYSVCAEQDRPKGPTCFYMQKRLDRDPQDNTPDSSSSQKRFEIKRGTDEDADFIYDNLDEFNDSVCPPLHGYIRMNKKLVDRDGNMIAAIQAGIGGWDEGYVHLLWVDEPYRGQGLASYLLEECEREARENGADVLFVYARDWVADFYRKHGFTEYGAAEDFPKGHRSCRLKKLL